MFEELVNDFNKKWKYTTARAKIIETPKEKLPMLEVAMPWKCGCGVKRESFEKVEEAEAFIKKMDAICEAKFGGKGDEVRIETEKTE